MEESEGKEDYIDFRSMAATIAKIRQGTPPVSPRLQDSAAGSLDSDQHSRKILSDGVTAKEEDIYQLPKANPTPSPHGQHINRPLVPPKIVKRTKLSKPLTQHSQQPTSSLHDQKQEVAVKNPVHKTAPDPNPGSDVTESSELNKMVHADDGELCAQEHSEGIYQTVKIKPVPLPRLSNMPLNPLVPPKTIMRPRPRKSVSDCPQSPTPPVVKDEITSNTPVDETIQSPVGSDVVNESTQSNNPNKEAADANDRAESSAQQDKTEQAESVTVQSPAASDVISEPTQGNVPNKVDKSTDANQTNARGSIMQGEAKQQRGNSYQMLKLNPPPSTRLYEKPLLPPISPKSDKSSLHSQSPTSSLDQEEITSDAPVDETVQSPAAGCDAANESTKSDKPNKVADSVETDQASVSESSVEDKTEQKLQSSNYQMLKTIQPLSRRNYEKQSDLIIPPRNIMRPKPDNSACLSPTSPLDKDEATSNTPVDETAQSPAASDVVNESTQNNKPNKAADSIDADQTNTRESSTQENKAEQEQRSGGYQTLKINPPPSSPKNYEKPVDPVVPPRNIMRPKSVKSTLHPQSPTSPLDKDKIQDKLAAVIQDKTKILTPPRQMNPYIFEFGSKRNVGSSSLKEKEPSMCDQQYQGSLRTQRKNTTPEVDDKEPSEEEQSYTLEEFVEMYQLPQLVAVTEGHYGTTEEFSMSEGMEILLFFKKKTQAVIATAQHTGETYHIPLNCSLQFSPYQHSSREHLTKSYHYKTVNHLLRREEGLPKVVKVLKGRKSAPAINANELIFPKGLSSKGTHLRCTDIRKEEIRLKLTCDIGFSTNPSDTKMDLEDYVEHINEFPSSAIVFCDREARRSIFDIHTGMEMVLQECKMLYSCICSTDVHGTMNYPLMELLTALPIEIKAISSPTVGLEPIYNTVKKVYETFNVSMVQSSMFLAQNDQHDYEVIRRSNNYLTFTRSVSFYSLEKPAVAFTRLPPRKKTQDPPVKSLPLPPRHDRPVSPQLQTQSHFFQHKEQLAEEDPDTDTDTDAYIYTTLADQRRLYLSSFTNADVLKLLDRLDLGLFKGLFQQNDIDGKAMLSFTKEKLGELGIVDSISQQKLLDVISGHTIYEVK